GRGAVRSGVPQHLAEQLDDRARRRLVEVTEQHGRARTLREALEHEPCVPQAFGRVEREVHDDDIDPREPREDHAAPPPPPPHARPDGERPRPRPPPARAPPAPPGGRAGRRAPRRGAPAPPRAPGARPAPAAAAALPPPPPGLAVLARPMRESAS